MRKAEIGMKTSQLEEKLGKAESFDEALVLENGAAEPCVLITGYMNKRCMSRQDFIRHMNIDRSYAYQLLNGNRIPTRNCLIKIALLLGLTVEQLQQLLKSAKKKSLYVKDLFDARVYYALKHDMSFEEAVEFVWSGEKAE